MLDYSRLLILTGLLSLSSLLSAQMTDYVTAIEKAHDREAFSDHQAIGFDIILHFGGTERLNARMTLATNSSAGLIEYAAGGRLLFKGDEVYYSPELAEKKGLRSSAYTWSYFFMFPYKLSDPGTNWSTFDGVSQIEAKVYDTARLSFDPGTGDAPDDWYITYADTESHILKAAAYIVTAGASREEAEEDPHAIEYLNYVEVDGIPISTEWRFCAWRDGKGLTEQLGTADLSNVRFIDSMDRALFSNEGLLKLEQ